jgi:hypothetical protein
LDRAELNESYQETEENTAGASGDGLGEEIYDPPKNRFPHRRKDKEIMAVPRYQGDTKSSPSV